MAKAKAKQTTPVKYKMGWLPDLPDARDYMYAAPLKVMQQLPAKTDLSNGFGKIYDQGALGSCTANALSGAFQFDRKKQTNKLFYPSRLFIYYNERALEHTVSTDSGAFLRDGIKSLNKQGVCDETHWPYDDTSAPGAKFAVKPPKSCYTSGLKNQILGYQRLILNLNTLKGCLAEGYPFVFGFTVYTSFISDAVRTTGIMPMPDLLTEQVEGGHATVAVGYDDARQAVLVRNSWGENWGLKGFFWMPYAYISSAAYCSDFWTIRVVA
ncbi:xylellain [Chitinophaga niastensis]|uniref:Xylellain n=1 Tax=Chitinophaga niastensis TaxID=536980 RepID=A0A2P8HP80_CHINA|nr:C1 family peptidase [Chitinophaga niastensis]PSL48018.1 xylellain [Chitinophaga niastensis]